MLGLQLDHDQCVRTCVTRSNRHSEPRVTIAGSAFKHQLGLLCPLATYSSGSFVVCADPQGTWLPDLHVVV